MAPLPPESTGRVWIDYIANGKAHTVQGRYAGAGAPTSDFLEGLDDIFLAFAPFMPEDWSFEGARYALPGSTVSIPLVFTPTTFDGQLAVKASESPAFMSLVGRDNLGRRVRWYQLGVGYSPVGEEGVGVDYRVGVTESTQVAAIFSAVATSALVTIGGADPAWKPYVNLGYNSYWQRKARG